MKIHWCCLLWNEKQTTKSPGGKAFNSYLQRLPVIYISRLAYFLFVKPTAVWKYHQKKCTLLAKLVGLLCFCFVFFFPECLFFIFF